MRKNVTLAIIALLMAPGRAISQAPQMVEGWPYLSHPGNQFVISPPRFDMQTSIGSCGVIFNDATQRLFKFHLDASFFPGWPLQFDSVEFGSKTPLVVDIDHDGFMEIVTIGEVRSDSNRYMYSLLYIVDEDGSVMAGFPITVLKPMSLNAADIDDDGEYEILTCAVGEGLIHCFDRYGNPRPGWPVELPDDIIGHTPGGNGAAVGDLDQDGNLEYVLAGLSNIYAYEFDGAMLPGFPIAIYDATYYFCYWYWPPILGDIDSDGWLEIIAPASKFNEDTMNYTSFVAIYEDTGEMKPGWPLMFPERLVFHTPTPADIDNNGSIDMGFQFGDSLTFVDVNGHNLPGWPKRLSSPNGYARGSQSDLMIADIDRDGDCEIFTDYNAAFADSSGDWYSYLFGIDHNGEELPGFPIIVNGFYLSRPPGFARFEDTGRLYMDLFTNIYLPWDPDVDTGYVEIYVFPDSTGPPDQWPMLSHDNLMTRNYNFVDNVTATDDPDACLPKTYVLEQNYPNPFNSSTTVGFALPKEEHVRLIVYDILGRAVSCPVDGDFAAGPHRVALDLGEAASGVYFYVLSTDRASVSRRMILVK